MREILFRGKRTNNGEWICGYYFFENTNVFANFNGCHYVHPCGQNQALSVVPETVGQYTGLTDKNGTPMYEGDIIKGAVHWLERYKLAWVGFKDGSFGLFWKRGDVIEFNPFTSLCNVIYEVVGNIFDNDIDNMEVEYDAI